MSETIGWPPPPTMTTRRWNEGRCRVAPPCCAATSAAPLSSIMGGSMPCTRMYTLSLDHHPGSCLSTPTQRAGFGLISCYPDAISTKPTSPTETRKCRGSTGGRFQISTPASTPTTRSPCNFLAAGL